MNVSTRQPDLMNAPLPLFDMMTGQQIVSEPSAPIQTGSMTLNNADMVHVQLLDRMVVVPSAIVNGPTLRQCVTRPSGQTPTDQQGHAYLLFVTWKNFKPLLDYLSGHVVKLPSDKSDLLELKQTARKFKAKEFERLVNRHLKHLYGGGCMGMLRMSNFSRSNKQAAAYSSPPKAQREAIHGPLQTPSKQKQLAPSAPQSGSTHVEQQGHMQPALPPVKLAPIRTKPAMKKSLFARVRRAQHFRAGKAYNVKRTGLNVDVNAQEQPQIIYDLQQPLIV